MRESGWYPPGAEFDMNAPYNQVDVPEEDFEITCCQTLSRTAIVTTNNYNPVVEDEPWNGIHEEYPDTSDTNWSEEYDECGYCTPLQLIQMLKGYLEKDLENVDEVAEKTQQNKAFLERKLKHFIEECDCWNEDETEFTEG